MSVTAERFDRIACRHGRVLPRGEVRRAGRVIGNGVVLGIGAVTAVALLVTAVTVAAAWMVNTGVAGKTQLHTMTFTGPGTLTLANGDPRLAVASLNFESKWARASAGGVPLLPQTAALADAPAKQVVARAPVAPPAVKRTAIDLALLSPKLTVAPADSVPLPRPHPPQREAFGPPVEKFTPQVAAVVAPQIAPVPSVPKLAMAALPPAPLIVDKRAAPQEAHNRAAPEIGDRTAVYDISARTVFLPSGEKLEAHSGLGDKLDDPKYVNVRMRGPTPPNVYELTLREQLFHGVRAIRLNPVDESKMHGRDGMLAHTYMLGPNGDSNGCVSFRDYNKFLQAFLRGEVDRLVVVPNGGTRLAAAVSREPASTGSVRRERAGRYAANDPPADRNTGSW